ncbi:glycosyltransferase family A protein [Temperatibacter marinus]|uniref:Glycosyltransferase family A protein n=1 Tax=Temperatibacter marinus TaxID=1456591 RepID=A0AA52EJ22_9PROT|nr:glycosyltransferase family A protein [Temperatibacter marinus]WND03194.1 glycosyltransferase family A protein [Temperatibacter marinus]
MIKTVQKDPKFGIVIPVFGHSRLVSEAIISACEQETEYAYKVIVVDDGCLSPETYEGVHSLVHAYKDKLLYVRQKNSKLPASRNKGITHLRKLYPSIEAYLFLDADNRLQPHSLETYYTALTDPRNEESVGWAYPDIIQFGLTNFSDHYEVRLTSESYSVLRQLTANISEAGSMVSAKVFDAGVFYDESLVHGFEDWDFWLLCIEAGFTACRVRNSGFLYRRRPESMLTSSYRMNDYLKLSLRHKHKALYSIDTVLAAKFQEKPTYAYVAIDRETVHTFNDPIGPMIESEVGGFLEHFDSWKQDPQLHFIADLIFVGSKLCREIITSNLQLTRALFWELFIHEFSEAEIEIRFGAFPGIIYSQQPLEKCHLKLLKTKQVESEKKLSLILCYPFMRERIELLPSYDFEGYSFEGFNSDQKEVAGHTYDDEILSYWGPSTQKVEEELLEEFTEHEGLPFFPVTNQEKLLHVGLDFTAYYVANPSQIDRLKELLVKLEIHSVSFEYETPQEKEFLMRAFIGINQIDIIPFRVISSEIQYGYYNSSQIASYVPHVYSNRLISLGSGFKELYNFGSLIAFSAAGVLKNNETSMHVIKREKMPQSLVRGCSYGDSILAFEHVIQRLYLESEADYRYFNGKNIPKMKLTLLKL